jgi:hypothetical protein
MTGKTILIIFILIGAAVVVAAKPAFLQISLKRAVRPIGSVLLTQTVRQGDTTKEIELNVRDDNGERTIKFLPVARERVEIRNIS